MHYTASNTPVLQAQIFLRHILKLISYILSSPKTLMLQRPSCHPSSQTTQEMDSSKQGLGQRLGVRSESDLTVLAPNLPASRSTTLCRELSSVLKLSSTSTGCEGDELAMSCRIASSDDSAKQHLTGAMGQMVGLSQSYSSTRRAPDTPHSSENSIYRTAFKLRSVQTLCQLDLVSSTLVQEVLLHPRVWKASAHSLSVPQLFRALQELFQRARVETRGQAQPRASELTLSLLMAMFDSTGVGVLKLLPVAAALIALSGDSPLTKYRALFQLYAENNKGGNESGTRITRRILRNLLTDLQQIPTVVGESRTLSSVNSAVRSCFQGVVSPGIKEEKFLSWVQSEPLILLWLPTCYRLSATEMVTHPVRCGICRAFPITGLRYRCLKCLNFDMCQVCFLSGVHSKSHQKSHPVIEHCVQLSAKENTKLLLKTLRNNLLQGRCPRRGDPRRPWLLKQVKPDDPAHHAQAEKERHSVFRGVQISAIHVLVFPMHRSHDRRNFSFFSSPTPTGECVRVLLGKCVCTPQVTGCGCSIYRYVEDTLVLADAYIPSGGPTEVGYLPLLALMLLSIQCNHSKNPVCVRPSRPVEATATETPSCDHQRLSQAQHVSHTGPHHQTVVSIRNELWRTRESINALQRERRLLKMQLNEYKDKLRAIYTFQEEKSCRFETKIQELTSNQNSLWSKLQQMRQDVQAMLQPLHPLSSCQHMVSKVDCSSMDQFWKGRDSYHIKNGTQDGPAWNPLPNPALVDRSQANEDHAPPDSESPATMVQTTSAQSYTQKIPKKILSSLPSYQQGLLQDKPQISPAEMSSTALASAGKEVVVNVAGRKDELEEQELQELLSKLMGAFNPERPSGPQSSVNVDLYGGAERVCRAFSALVDQITLPSMSEKESRLKAPSYGDKCSFRI
ncbi:PREDICTED: LOW QUALITY PROTEIN: dystrotelin [Chinchilla lanigera]|uniref:LOW QUALITY PROTEIN: dystrotelin n=1 Tax=Chinchilla lanigera TaxID=34839 RepID=UPI000697FFCE|nr:PREDICTED: LOW QUALITY PROTEIN: dystrotelin [Chinchilla lanigera]